MNIKRNSVIRIELGPEDTVRDLYQQLGRTANGAIVSIHDGTLIATLESD